MKARAQKRGGSLVAATSAVAIAAAGVVTGCGGGGYVIPAPGDKNSQAQSLTCATTCIASNTVDIDQLRQSYVLVNDGASPRALVAFGTGRDPRANVELKGDDQIRLVTSTGSQAFYIPAPSSLAAALVEALFLPFTLGLAGASPYESDINQAQAAQPVQFQFVRGATVYSSAVTLPPNFSFAAPLSNAALPISMRTLQVQLTTSVAASLSLVSANCTDSNGNTANGSSTGLLVLGSPVTAGNGTTSYNLDLGSYVDGLNFTTTYPRGVLSKCSLDLQAITQVSGQAAAGLGSTIVVAQQMRTVSFSLR